MAPAPGGADTGVPVGVQGTFDELGPTLAETTFVVVDLETTGGSPATSAITEIGAVKVRGGVELGEFQTLVDPGSPIPAFISVLTGITDQMVADAPRIGQVLPAFLEFARGAVVVAHNARFDVGFLRAACEEEGLEWPDPRSSTRCTWPASSSLVTRRPTTSSAPSRRSSRPAPSPTTGPCTTPRPRSTSSTP